MLIRKLLTQSARDHGETIAIQDSQRGLTWAQLEDETRALARGLAGRGIGRGDRVAIVSKNRWEYASLYFACAEIGAVLVPLNWRLRASELQQLLVHSRAGAVFASIEYRGALESVLDAANGLRLRCTLDPDPSGRGEWTLFKTLQIPEHSAAEFSAALESDAAIQMYTSGTTGFPKGALLTNRNVCSLATAWSHEIDLRADRDRFLQVTPLFHVGGMLMLMSVAQSGATLLLHPEFQPDHALRALREDGATHALFVPAMLQWLLLQPEAEACEYPALRVLAYGAAPAGPELLRRAAAVFGCGFLQGYGLTETSGVLTVLRPEDHRHADEEIETARLASIGRAIGCCEVRVVDDQGLPVEPTEVGGGGEIGEIVARGDNVFAGYWELSEANEECWRDGWFRTGDLARIDLDGFITIVDRIKDMILVGGENVYPSEIERVLLQHEAVADTVVIGIPHEVWGEEVLAFVQLSKGVAIGDRDLIQHCRAVLARFKCPTKVRFLDLIPRNAAGKCEKRALREPFWEGRDRKV